MTAPADPRRHGGRSTGRRRASGAAPVLRLSDVHTYYGRIHALQGISPGGRAAARS